MQSQISHRVHTDSHRIEADVTMGGTEVFRVTNLETDNTSVVRRKGKVASTKMRGRPLPDNVIEALERADIGIIS